MPTNISLWQWTYYVDTNKVDRPRGVKWLWFVTMTFCNAVALFIQHWFKCLANGSVLRNYDGVGLSIRSVVHILLLGTHNCVLRTWWKTNHMQRIFLSGSGFDAIPRHKQRIFLNGSGLDAKAIHMQRIFSVARIWCQTETHATAFSQWQHIYRYQSLQQTNDRFWILR